MNTGTKKSERFFASYVPFFLCVGPFDFSNSFFLFFTNSYSSLLLLLSIDSFHFPNFFFTKSSYLLRSFLARFPSLYRFFRFSKFFFTKSFYLLRSFVFPSLYRFFRFSFSQSSFTNSFLQTLIYRDFSSFVFLLCIDFPRSFSQSIQSIYRDFSSLVFFLSIDSFDSPTSFSQTIQSIYYVFVPPSLFTIRKQAFNLDRHRFTAQMMFSRSDSSLRDFSPPIHAPATKIPQKFRYKRRFITATAVEVTLFSPALLLLLPLSPPYVVGSSSTVGGSFRIQPRSTSINSTRRNTPAAPPPLHCIEFVIPAGWIRFFTRVS